MPQRARDNTGYVGHDHPRHVWVVFNSERSPGVLLEWRRDVQHGQWYAQVMYATGGGTSSVGVRLGWLPAAHVEPLK